MIDTQPEMNAEEAVRRALREYGRQVQRNEPLVRAGLDPEALHDFRVAVRRTRSILKLLSGVFAAGSVDAFRDEIAWLGSITGECRDLDVFLLELERGPSHGLSGLLPYLRARRREEYALLVEALDSDRYRDLMGLWMAIDADDARGAPGADRVGEPIRAVVVRRLREVHQGLVGRGRSIRKGTKAPKLHRIRIRAKKLRYLLDAFRDLFDGEDVAFVIRHLKGLQDVLGRFNDLEVQKLMLQRTAQDLDSRGSSSVALLLALGREIERRDRASRRARKKVRGRFASFDRPEVHRRLAGMLGEGVA